MSTHARFLAAAAALAAGLLAVTTGAAGAVPADSGSASPSGPPPMTMPSGSMSPGSGASGSMASTTWKFYGVNTFSGLQTSNGQPVTNPSTPPNVGDYAVATDNDYLGDHTSHSSEISATDHLFCLFTKAPATATCSAQIATSQGMLLADNSVQDFSSQAPTMNFKITGGTGAYQGAKGTVQVTNIANTNNADFVVTWSK